MQISRRGFLAGIGSLVGGLTFGKYVAAETVSAKPYPILWYNEAALRNLEKNFRFTANPKPIPQYNGKPITLYFHSDVFALRDQAEARAREETGKCEVGALG